ncbi:PAS domain S-box-containing protein [Peptoclostridium litorale DSM 5388]|uniref:PAS modulated sigma54 specific transcriptional regulator, Fis family n=1 Tax=Peptoclostridium litorale DSM 5388 TaxID=1121324 RepID=A0A069RCB9_PEPLI|nr:sigma 54-interacting transcriptional regulator [Peptoclostridium litorale]KDR94428.1 PAS modulated sigma54 specific transcriptional regulator, Fis family [Peptoclostridium litorale DSM 5388]SIO24063.1 PAS domain S-box-containing protein [Peptoclostridium litorale DSM 5388]
MKSQFKLEKDFFIYEDEKDFDEIIRKFQSSNTVQLPVLSIDKHVVGVLCICDYVKCNCVKRAVNTKFASIQETEHIADFKNIDQEVFPFVNRFKKYIGFVRKADILKYIEIKRFKQAFNDKNKKELKFYRDIHSELNSILELSSDGIFITDGSGNVLRMNSACEKLDGVKKENIIGKNMDELVRTSMYSNSVALQVLEQGQRITVIQKVNNGKEVVSTGTPVFKDGKISMVVVNVRDVTELNNLKNQLKKANDISEKISFELETLRMQQMDTGNMILDSPAMKKIAQLALKVAKVSSTVLIEGESGVGKGVISKFIHNNSSRKEGPFIKIECSSIPENLLESELFGYEKGAFTGAERTGKIGLVELANGGTLFLDEIGEIPLNTQVKLLRLIQDREFLKIGGKTPIAVDIRIIAATNKDLRKLVAEKKFREDLFYRLNVIPVYIPPLRERKEALGSMILKNIEQFNEKYKMDKELDPEALKKLMNYKWPGNVRELENIMEMLVVTSTGRIIDIYDLPANIKESDEILSIAYGSSFKGIMDDYEKKILLKAMEESSNTQEMSKILDIDSSTIRRKLKKHNIKIAY